MTEQPEPLTARKLTAWVPASAQELADAEEMRKSMELAQRVYAGTATPSERQEFERNIAARDAERKRSRAAAVTEWEQVRERYADVPAVLAVLDIHQPADDGSLECAHPVFGWESDAEDWPCGTYEAIRDAVR